MGISQKSRWDDAGSEPGAGSAKYVAGDQPIAEYDNWFNKAAVDDIGDINKRFFDALYPEQQSTPDMTLKVNAGKVYFGTSPLSYAGGNTSSFTAPTTNPRIDLVTLDSTGTLAIIQGTEAASPSPPTYPSGKMVICEVYNRVGETSIKTEDDSTNGYIYKDVRPFIVLNRSHPVQVSYSDTLKEIFTTFKEGSDIFHAHDADALTYSITYFKLKTITLGYLPDDTLKISFSLCTATEGHTAYGKIYRNGVPVGTEQSSSVICYSYGSFEEVISGWQQGDTLELWAHTDNATFAAHVANLRLLGTLKNISNS